MTKEELYKLLNELRSLPSETEWVEFKEAGSSYSFNKLGRYFSALGNEANLKGKPYGWLIFGVEDKARKIIGTYYRRDRSKLDSLKSEIANKTTKLDSLKSEIANKTTNRITFTEIHELLLSEGRRVIMFQIPAAPRGIPVAWEGHYYGRDGESLCALNIQEIEQIRNQHIKYDWSAQICKDATLNDLEPQAIGKAREQFKEKNKNSSTITPGEVDSWGNITFLNKAKVTIQGKITNTAILLLGKEESASLISPAVAKMSWILKDKENIELDYEHFGPPFLVNVERLFSRIRNLTYRTLPSGTLFPIEATQYDPWVIREVIHNCIAHQDYELGGRINVVENPASLIFTNAGSFLPGSVEQVIGQDAPQEIYRNPFLAEAMVQLNMIDTRGGGIKKMFTLQMERFFPLPDYDLKEPYRVKVHIRGEIIDEKYSRLLIDNADLDIWTVILIDKVQKRVRITKDEHSRLKKQRLIEGRYPNLFVAAKIASATGMKARHIRDRGFDKKYYQDMILALIREHAPVKRQDIDELILPKLPEVLSQKQKKAKIHNLLFELSAKMNKIKNIGSRKCPQWVLLKNE
ncbi:MAG: putative DNA binding domain-containing protein [Deltaproteobacteria bacterium]|nr:putative DNA binding domain-containing protein [Deltaproteobacteria bacterium]